MASRQESLTPAEFIRELVRPTSQTSVALAWPHMHAAVIDYFDHEHVFALSPCLGPYLYVALQGRSRVRVAFEGAPARDFELAPGDMLAAPSLAAASGTVRPEPGEAVRPERRAWSRNMLVVFEPALMDKLARQAGLGGWNCLVVDASLCVHDPEAAAICDSLAREVRNPNENGHAFVTAAAQFLAARLLSRRCRRAVQSPTIAGGLTMEQLALVDAHLAGSELKAVSLQTMAAAAGLSPYYFCRAYKIARGETPGKTLTALRLERAKTLLRETEQSVKTIAQGIGYDSASYFTTLFKKKAGMSPKEFRKA